MKKTIYIAGKISGLPYCRTYAKFLLREIFLRLKGFNTINPMRVVPKNWSYGEQMALCFDLVNLADCIYISHNWRNSPGAFREIREHFRGEKIAIYYYKFAFKIMKYERTDW